MTQEPSGGWAPENVDVPGEFNAGPGYNAAERGVPGNLDRRRFTDRQREAGRTVPAQPVSAAKLAAAMRRTEPTDPGATPDPFGP